MLAHYLTSSAIFFIILLTIITIGCKMLNVRITIIYKGVIIHD